MAYPDSDYPGGYDTPADPDTTLDGTPLHSDQHLFLNDAIEHIEAELGLSPSGSHATVVARLDAIQKLTSAGEVGPDDGTATSGTSAKTVSTTTVPDQGAGRIHVWANVYVSKTVSTDRFNVILQAAGSSVNQAVEPVGADAGSWAFAVSGSVAVAGGSTSTINVLLARTSGAGTATAQTGALTSLHYIFIPSP